MAVGTVNSRPRSEEAVRKTNGAGHLSLYIYGVTFPLVARYM